MPNRVPNNHRTETEQTPNRALLGRGRAILSRRLRDAVLLMTRILTLKIYSIFRTETLVISGPLALLNLSALAGSRSRLNLWAQRSDSNEWR